MYVIILSYSRLEELTIEVHNQPYYEQAAAIAAADALVATKLLTCHTCSASVAYLTLANEVYCIPEKVA